MQAVVPLFTLTYLRETVTLLLQNINSNTLSISNLVIPTK